MGPNMGPTWAPRGPPKRPKSAFEIDPGSPFFGFDVGRPWKTDLGAIWDPSWGPLGPILGASGANLGPSWANLGASWAHFGVNLAPLGHLLTMWGVILRHVWSILPMMPTFGRYGDDYNHDFHGA